MNAALLLSKERVGDINAQVEDSLAGIRVVKSFTNEALEATRFEIQNQRFVDSRRNGYKNEAYFFGGMTAFTQLITISVIVLGGIFITHASLDLADLVTYLLCVAILVDPVQRLANFSKADTQLISYQINRNLPRQREASFAYRRFKIFDSDSPMSRNSFLNHIDRVVSNRILSSRLLILQLGLELIHSLSERIRQMAECLE